MSFGKLIPQERGVNTKSIDVDSQFSLKALYSNHLQAMRLFVGEPVWTPINRPADDHESRQKYVESFLDTQKPVAVN